MPISSQFRRSSTNARRVVIVRARLAALCPACCEAGTLAMDEVAARAHDRAHEISEIELFQNQNARRSPVAEYMCKYFRWSNAALESTIEYAPFLRAPKSQLARAL